MLITVFFAGAFFAGTGFLTTVVLLESLFSLIVLALPLPTVGADAGGAARLPRPAPAVLVSAVTFRVTVALVVFAFSTILVSNPAAPPGGTGADGFKGEAGRARNDFCGDIGRAAGDRGSVRELADRGERTCDGWIFARDVVRAGGTGAARVLFFGFSISSFSLSTSSLEFISKIYSTYRKDIYLNLFGPRFGDGLARERVCSACNRFFEGELTL